LGGLVLTLHQKKGVAVKVSLKRDYNSGGGKPGPVNASLGVKGKGDTWTGGQC